MPPEPLCPDPATWRIAAIVSGQDWLRLLVEPLRRAVACPVCGARSRRVHDCYHRKPWDLTWGHWPVPLPQVRMNPKIVIVTIPLWPAHLSLLPRADTLPAHQSLALSVRSHG